MTSRVKRLHPLLQQAIKAGLMTEGEALDVDAFTDRREDANREAEKQAVLDALARPARKKNSGPGGPTSNALGETEEPNPPGPGTDT